jgi:WD40 repeat protein
MRTLQVLALAMLLTPLTRAEIGLIPSDQKQHKQTSGNFPYTQGLGSEGSAKSPAVTSTPDPAAGHAVDKRYARQVRDTQVTLDFPSDDAGALDPRPCSQGFPLETLLKLQIASHPQAANDGGVYFLSDPLDPSVVPQLFYQASVGSAAQALTSLPQGVSDFQVSPDGKHILLLTSAEGGESRVTLWEVARHEAIALLAHQNISAVVWSPDSTWFAYTSNARVAADLDLYL